MLARVLGEARRELHDVLRARTFTHERYRDHLVVITFVTFVVTIVCSAIAFLLERHAPKTDINSFGDAVFWSTTQLLSVSSSLQNPISTGARALDVFMEIYAITVIAALAGATTSFLHRRTNELEKSGSRGAKNSSS
jgi:Trk-type K+ transport system membrane component